MGKQNLYEHVKPPLVFAGPGIPHGKSDALVYLFDLFPTICDLAGATVPEVVEGKSLLPIIQGEQTSRARHASRRLLRPPSAWLRDSRWKLQVYNAGGERNVQLFDLQTDPDEIQNLADDPAFADRAHASRNPAHNSSAEHFDDPVDFR